MNKPGQQPAAALQPDTDIPAASPAPWFIYLIRCRDGQLYTGITTDVERRLSEHRAGKGAKYLRGRTPLSLAFSQQVGSHSDALKMERSIKKLSKTEKEKLICSSDCISGGET
ncbi:GIY-YIG nuclease family protein [Mariprofundus erugo]|uniref:GIY-YIG nuclease family protein n=1 Tax=Mariprofundus erugo TaxID=2528639 RepID=UPI0010FF2ADA|nr:GIY-YIG nuclease family protein [Mariprofundus erugo]TLS76387.1 GIY-YIG nuclease family protein [Mariprofundus erugo]